MSKAEPITQRRPVGRRAKPVQSTSARTAVAGPAGAEAQLPSGAGQLQLLAGGLALAAGLWAYWPTLLEIVRTWNREPDYSHGFLVVPLALAFLWFRRDSFPGVAAPAYVLGLGLLAASVAARYFGARFYMEFIDGYSIILWVTATVALIGGGRLLWWALPSIGFLFFMIPLPFGIETAMSYPLQQLATRLSCFALQVLGQPAFAEGNTILLGDQKLEVEQACSGLRLFMSMIAVAYGYAVLVRRSWWERGLLFLAVVPVAIFSNVTRITVTGLLYQFATGQWAHWFAHESAGYAMIVLAMCLFGMMLWYLSLLIREEEVVEMSALVRDARL